MTEDLTISDFKMRDERAMLPDLIRDVQPKGQHILVRPIVERMSEILEVTTDVRDRIVRGEVISLGPKVKSRLGVGDIVYFSQIQRYQVTRELWIIRDNNLAFVDETHTDQARAAAERAIADMERTADVHLERRA